MNIKMIGLDLDGTVFDNNKNISRRNREAIQAAIEKGVVVLPATGRPLIGLPKQMLEIPGIRYALTSNGGAIYDLGAQKPVYTDYISNAQALAIADALLNHIDGLVEIYIDGVCYTDEANFYRAINFYKNLPAPIIEYMKVSRTPKKDLMQFIKEYGKGAEKMHMMFNDDCERQKAFKLMGQFDGLFVTSASSFNMEINKESADKGNGLIALGRLLGIEKEEIMACGDAGNDLPMLQKVGFAVAMGNAEAEIKAAADYITGTNEADGVAAAIEKFVLGSC